MHAAARTLVLGLTFLAATVAVASAKDVEKYVPGRWIASASVGLGVNGLYGTDNSPMLGVSAEYGLNDKLSAGASIGYNKVSVESSNGLFSDGAGVSYLLYGLHAGARYYFNDRFAGFGELGYGLGNVALSVAMRF